jgi:two-component system NtrC family sensor kinase
MSKSNILIIDDTPANLQLLTSMLVEQGYQIFSAISGKVALNVVQKTLPDLILLDINMPGMNGYEVCEQLKANEKTRDIPVIFISALSETLDKVKAFFVGGVDYVTKPFQTEEVLARVKTHLQLHQLQQQLTAQNEELHNTLEKLQTTQQELIQSEKMAALGQLIAGVAHEINTPLGAISSSVNSIKTLLSQTLTQLPEFFRSLSEAQLPVFLALLQKALAKEKMLSAKEERKLKRKLIRQLEEQEIENVPVVADTLVDMGIYDNLEPWLSLLKCSESQRILNTADKLSDLKRSSQAIEIAAHRASKVVFALKSFARFDQSGEKVKADITEGLETVLTLYHNQLKSNHLELIKHYTQLPPIWCYADELNQVWTNLIQNALQAMDYQGTLTIDASQQNHQIVVSITDSGKGIAQEIKEKIFEPFFTTKRAGEGSGLGLDIVRKIVEKHGGNITVASQPGNTTFTVSIPVSPPS